MAMTLEQAEEKLKRRTDNLAFIFDGDPPGFRSEGDNELRSPTEFNISFGYECVIFELSQGKQKIRANISPQEARVIADGLYLMANSTLVDV